MSCCRAIHRRLLGIQAAASQQVWCFYFVLLGVCCSLFSFLLMKAFPWETNRKSLYNSIIFLFIFSWIFFPRPSCTSIFLFFSSCFLHLSFLLFCCLRFFRLRVSWRPSWFYFYSSFLSFFISAFLWERQKARMAKRTCPLHARIHHWLRNGRPPKTFWSKTKSNHDRGHGYPPILGH